MTGFESKRQMAQTKMTDESDTLTIVYQRGFADGKRSAERKPLTDEMVHKAMIAINTASHGEIQPTFEEMKAAIEAAHGIKEGT